MDFTTPKIKLAITTMAEFLELSEDEDVRTFIESGAIDDLLKNVEWMSKQYIGAEDAYHAVQEQLEEMEEERDALRSARDEHVCCFEQ